MSNIQKQFISINLELHSLSIKEMTRFEKILQKDNHMCKQLELSTESENQYLKFQMIKTKKNYWDMRFHQKC